VRVVLAAMRAELFHFETLGGRLLVLGACVVPVFAFLTLERDDFSRHFYYPLLMDMRLSAAFFFSAPTNAADSRISL